MANSLRPPSSINDLRTQAHLNLSARLQSLDLTPLLIMTLGSNIPASIIPYLIWQLDMMIPAVPMQALGVSALTILQNALPLHQKLGTVYALKQALLLCGYPGVTILEGQSSWGGTSWPANEGWAVFRVNLGTGGSGGLYAQAPSGLINGSNRNFTLPALPNPSASLRVFYNGLLQVMPSGYSAAGTALTMAFTPASGSDLGVAFRTSPVTSPILALLTQVINYFKPITRWLDQVEINFPQFFDNATPTVSGSTLVLPETPITLELYRNGLFQLEGVDYTISGAVVTPTVPIGSASFLAFGAYGSSGTTPNFQDWITPAGTVNGTNVTFTLPTAPSPAASLKLYSGYQLLKQGSSFADPTADYTLSGTTITYRTAPPTGRVHYAFYRD